MTEEAEPDFPIEDLALLGTAPQISMVNHMADRFGWKASHLWEKEPGVIVVWCITTPPLTELLKTDTYVHCYVDPEGKVVRYNPKRG